MEKADGEARLWRRNVFAHVPRAPCPSEQMRQEWTAGSLVKNLIIFRISEVDKSQRWFDFSTQWSKESM